MIEQLEAAILDLLVLDDNPRNGDLILLRAKSIHLLHEGDIRLGGRHMRNDLIDVRNDATVKLVDHQDFARDVILQRELREIINRPIDF